MNKTKTNEVNLIRSRALTVIFSMLISALMLLPLFTSAKGKDKAAKTTKVYMQPLNKDYHAAVSLVNLEEGKYTLTIESENGVNVYYDAVLKSPESFAKVFDFSRLEDGEYTIRVKNKEGVVERHFGLENGKVKVYYEEKEEPVFKTVGQKAIFVLPNENNLNYSIRVLDAEGEQLFATNENASTIKKMFDFSNVEAGRYQILVSSNKSDYSFDFVNQR
ncbi:MAG: hypothetical protein A2W96_02280 [Bacteroidetes bacterium GWD2_40_43]|nr:MAG: hypothetical protein A2W96_02280 [Bacteroidetes bacterium GWD2_40_43]